MRLPNQSASAIRSSRFAAGIMEMSRVYPAQVSRRHVSGCPTGQMEVHRSGPTGAFTVRVGGSMAAGGWLDIAKDIVADLLDDDDGGGGGGSTGGGPSGCAGTPCNCCCGPNQSCGYNSISGSCYCS